MIKRVNLVEKKALAFTYLKLVQVCLVVLLINFILVALQMFNAGRLEKKLASEQTLLGQLEAKRDELVKRPTVKTKISVGQYQEILDRIENTPRWSALIQEVTKKLPNKVWITNFKSVSTTETVATDPDQTSKSFRDKKTTPDDDAALVPIVLQSHKMEVEGTGSDMRNITEFASSLAKSESFKNLTLAESAKQAFGVAFTIRGEIKTHAR